MSRRMGQDPDSHMLRRREWREGEQKWWEGEESRNGGRAIGGREFYGEKRGGRERWEDDMRERDEARRGGEEVGGGGRWRGGRERRYQWIMVVRV